MFVIFPFIGFFAVYFLVSACMKDFLSAWRSQFLFSSLLWGVVLLLGTELLGYFQLLSFYPILFFWAIVIIISCGISFSSRCNVSGFVPDVRMLCSRNNIIFSLCILFTVSLIGLVSFLAPPNNFDSMTYHMSRVVHWVQNQTIAYYPTSIMRQLWMTPMAEFVILHFQILSGGDYFANMVQYLSMIGSIIGVSLIAEKLGANKAGQLVSAVVLVTIPMGMMQASSSQNDYVVAFWLVCFVYFLLRFNDDANLINSVGIGVSFGLAFITKATSILFAFPFALWGIIHLVKSRNLKVVKYAPLMILLILAINTGHFLRNYGLGYQIMSPTSLAQNMSNKKFGKSAFISNPLRNLGLHLGTPVDSVNEFLENQIYAFHDLIDLDITNPDTTYGSHQFHIPRNIHEDDTGNVRHLFLFFLCSIVLFMSRELKRYKYLLWYFTSIVLMFLCFSVYLKWQPWHSRLMTAIFVLSAPLIGVVLSRILSEKVLRIFCVCMVLLSIPWLFRNQAKRIVSSKNSIFNTSRMDQYFAHRKELIEDYNEAVDYLVSKNCTNLGLLMNADAWEYPFWVLIKEKSDKIIRIEHVSVNNISARYKYPLGAFFPEHIVATNSLEDEVLIGNQSFIKDWEKGSVCIFSRKNSLL